MFTLAAAYAYWLNQENLSDAISLKFQQAQKYEGGADPIGSCLLFKLSRILDEPVSLLLKICRRKSQKNTPAQDLEQRDYPRQPSQPISW